MPGGGGRALASSGGSPGKHALRVMLSNLLLALPALPVTIIVLFMTKKCGVVGLGSAAEMVCSHMPGLTERQREMCRAAPDAMVAVGQGYRLGIAECQHHFAMHRWNCTPIGNKNSFGHVVVVGSREAAYTYGVSSAGVAYSVAAACSRGNITSCGCQSARRVAQPASSWKWAGCSVDIGFGLGFARRFLDAREIEQDPRSLMNLHNNRAGRTAVKSKMVRECKCHGVSGSCTMRTCWRALPQFRLVADHLMRKYWRARAVVSSPTGLQTRKGRQRPKRSDLVFLEPSPNYCEKDLAAGSLGTAGRTCNRSSSGMGGCDVLCCGRGYNTQQSVRSWQCNCKFHWCCYVQCQTCSQRTQLYTCN